MKGIRFDLIFRVGKKMKIKKTFDLKNAISIRNGANFVEENSTAKDMSDFFC